jgi:hypothetical protein
MWNAKLIDKDYIDNEQILKESFQMLNEEEVKNNFLNLTNESINSESNMINFSTSSS